MPIKGPTPPKGGFGIIRMYVQRDLLQLGIRATPEEITNVAGEVWDQMDRREQMVYRDLGKVLKKSKGYRSLKHDPRMLRELFCIDYRNVPQGFGVQKKEKNPFLEENSDVVSGNTVVEKDDEDDWAENDDNSKYIDALSGHHCSAADKAKYRSSDQQQDKISGESKYEQILNSVLKRMCHGNPCLNSFSSNNFTNTGEEFPSNNSSKIRKFGGSKLLLNSKSDGGTNAGENKLPGSPDSHINDNKQKQLDDDDDVPVPITPIYGSQEPQISNVTLVHNNNNDGNGPCSTTIGAPPKVNPPSAGLHSWDIVHRMQQCLLSADTSSNNNSGSLVNGVSASLSSSSTTAVVGNGPRGRGRGRVIINK